MSDTTKRDLSEVDLKLLEEDHFTAQELAERWKTTTGYLANRRYLDRGPAYIKLGTKILYPIDDVIAFEAENKHPTRSRRRPDSRTTAAKR